MSQIKNIEEWEILTPDGWQDFEGIKKVTKESALKITFISPSGSEETFICSKSHQVLIERNEERSFLFAELLDIEIDKLVCGDLEQTCQIKSIDVIDETTDLYDLVNVKSGFRYVANGLVNHNCAHIENIDDLWLGLYPTLSCVAGDTLILTDKGFIKIEDYHSGKKVGDYFELKIPVYGKNGMEETSHGYVSPESKTYIITTSKGAKLEVTPKHPLYSLQKNGMGKMIQAQNLKIGDLLRNEYAQNIFGNKKLDPQLAYMLGGYIAEGWITKSPRPDGKYDFNTIYIENSDDNFRNVYLKNNNLEKKFSTTSRKTRIRCCSRQLIKEWMDLGIDPLKKCHTKTTPKIIFECDKDTIGKYLSGLFDGDGSISANSGGPTISSTSEKLIRETALLMRNMGFIVNVFHNKPRLKDLGRIMPQGRPLKSLKENWTLAISRSQIKLFNELIGFKIKRKSDRAHILAEKYSQDDRKLNLIPISHVGLQIKQIYKDSGQTKKWFRQRDLRLDKCLDGKSNRKITQEWLSHFQDICVKDLKMDFTQEQKSFFQENIGTFFWDEIIKIEESFNKTYDFTVPKTHTFLQNGILGSNTGGSAILISTPNGVGNLFHKLYSGAENGENDFHPIELKWDRNPEHTEEWFEEQKKQIIAAKGMRGVAQELMCEFNASGETFLKSEVMMELETFLKDPIKHHHMSHDIWIWEEPQEGKKYVISADIARGDSQDFSAFHIIDTVDDQIVCEYKGKITPDRFADMLYAIGEEYNKALICPELNSFGMVTSNKLKMIGYPNLYYDKYMKNAHMSEFIDENQISDSDQPGILISVKNREFLLANLENVLRNRKISFYSKRLYSELKTFVWKSTGKASAQKGYNDDLIMALSMGAGIYESSGRSNHSQDDKEITMALLAGMSRGTKKLNSDFKTTTVQTSPILPVYTTSQLKEEAEKSSISNDGSNNSGERQISKEEYWNMWDWVSKD